MEDGKKWFSDARFGMFIHWGIYSVCGRGEWVRNRERIPQKEYADLYGAQSVSYTHLTLPMKRIGGFAVVEAPIIIKRKYVQRCRRWT